MKNKSNLNGKNRETFCLLCERPIPKNVPQSIHHLIPKSKGGKHGPRVLLHHICHKQIHSIFSEKELASSYNEIGKIKEHPIMGKFLRWVSKRPPDFISRTLKPDKYR